jgi:hypothetical protein
MDMNMNMNSIHVRLISTLTVSCSSSKYRLLPKIIIYEGATFVLGGWDRNVAYYQSNTPIVRER